jgi:hypothetical protein
MVIMNLKMTKEHMNNVMEEYIKLPDDDLADRKLMSDILKSIHEYDSGVLNNTVLHSLKLIMLFMCENCEEYCENEKYKRIQENLR